MPNKLVFSGYKFLETCLNDDVEESEILWAFKKWADDCEGKTEEEMWPFKTNSGWMVEVDG